METQNKTDLQPQPVCTDSPDYSYFTEENKRKAVFCRKAVVAQYEQQTEETDQDLFDLLTVMTVSCTTQMH